jgi:dipeptidyl aminopeptidase/acylaminoacyl peptidase
VREPVLTVIGRPESGARRFVLIVLCCLLAACARGSPASSQPSSTATVQPASATVPPTVTALPAASRTAAATDTASPSSTPTVEPTATVSPTPDPYAGLYIDTLRVRTYDSQLEIGPVLAVTQSFTRSLITYTGDGLTLHGYINVPRGQGPFPVVIVNHGYIDPGFFSTVTYMARYTDALAEAGFLVVHPDYRGYGASDGGPNLFRIGYAVDVLYLIDAIQKLPMADPNAIGLFGHSMGGGISLRVATISDEVDAVLLYGSMSGDEHANLGRLVEWTGLDDLPELSVPDETVARLAPIEALDKITAALSLHHGEADTVVPPEWTADLYQRLTALGKPVEYFSYPGQPHTFVGDAHTLLLERAIAFFRQHLAVQ